MEVEEVKAAFSEGVSLGVGVGEGGWGGLGDWRVAGVGRGWRWCGEEGRDGSRRGVAKAGCIGEVLAS